jgi:hypothetical protein
LVFLGDLAILLDNNVDESELGSLGGYYRSGTKLVGVT